MSEVMGGALALALIGALFALVLRRFASLGRFQSYVAGVSIAAVLAAWLYSRNTGVSFGSALWVYGLAAPIALVLLWMPGRRNKV